MPHLKARSGLSWSYDTKGKGETILFLHGWGCNRNVWKQQFEYFSSSYQVIALDLPGHGESGWLPLTLQVMAEDLDSILQELGVKQVNIVASSLGGLLAIKLAAITPAKIRRLVFIGSLPKFSQSADHPHGLEVERIRILARQLETDYPAIVQIFFRSLFTGQERRGERYKWLQQFAPMETFPQKAALQEFLTILEKEDLRGEFRNILSPIQFINGTDDYICSQASAEALKGSVSGARLEIFKDCGHFPFLTKPREFNEVVEGFLKAGN